MMINIGIKIRLLALALLCHVSWASSAWARIASMPNLSDLADAPVIILVDANKIKVEPLPSGWDSAVVFEGCEYLKGRGSDKLEVGNQIFMPPAGAKSYLVFLTESSGKLCLKNDSCSMIGFANDVNVSPSDVASLPELQSFLSGVLFGESDSECAMLESYLLYETPADVVKPAWMARKKEVSPSFALAQLNAGLCTVGAAAFKEMEPQNVASCFARKSEGDKVDNFYQFHVEKLIVAWAFRNANPEKCRSDLRLRVALWRCGQSGLPECHSGGASRSVPS